MKTLKQPAFTALAVIVVFGFLFTGCNDGTEDGNPIAVKSVKLDPGEFGLKVGETKTLTPIFTPKNATNKTVTWHSDNPSAATVSDDGVVTAKAKGDARITVTTKNGKKDTCVVTVTSSPDGREVSVTLDENRLDLVIDEEATLTATVSPSTAGQTVTWISGDDTVATVSAAGVVKAIGVGDTIITATSDEDNDATATCAVYVTLTPVAVTGVELDIEEYEMAVGERITLRATVKPEHAHNKKVTWSSNSTAIATVTNAETTIEGEDGEPIKIPAGTVIAVSEGEAIITVTTDEKQTGNQGFTATCVVTVKNVPVTGIELSKDFLYLAPNGEATLTATIEPSDATNQDVNWTSNNAGVTVAGGVVKAGAAAGGPFTITATSADNNTVKATCTVYVGVPATEVGLYLFDYQNFYALPATVDLPQGYEFILAAFLEPETATIDTYSIQNSKPAVVEIGSTQYTNLWFVTGLSEGVSTITVSAGLKADGLPATATLVVNVTYTPVEEVRVSPTTLRVGVGATANITATVLPSDADDDRILWSSSNSNIASVVPAGSTYPGYLTGRVTGVAVGGPVTITATSVDNGTIKATCTVTVAVAMPKIEGMVWIEPGTFQMGSPAGETGRNADETQHTVTLTKGFYMAEYPVTGEVWMETMGVYLGQYTHYPVSGNQYEGRWKEFPVDAVSWNEAIIYCNKRSMEEHLTPVYSMYKDDAPNANYMDVDWDTNEILDYEDIPANWSTDPDDWSYPPGGFTWGAVKWLNVRMNENANGYRLPTEAEWEYACRAGTTSAYNTGDTITSAQANFGNTQPFPVKMNDPNAFGLYDMHGNVAEWCWDKYGDYGDGAKTDPREPKDTRLLVDDRDRVMRGGSFAYDAAGVRSAARNKNASWNKTFPNNYFCGFRLVRNAPNSPSTKIVNNAPAAPSGAAGAQVKVLPQGIWKRDGNSAPVFEAVRGEAILRRNTIIGQ